MVIYTEQEHEQNILTIQHFVLNRNKTISHCKKELNKYSNYFHTHVNKFLTIEETTKIIQLSRKNAITRKKL